MHMVNSGNEGTTISGNIYMEYQTEKNRMSREEYLKKCEEVEDTAYAQEGNPQTFGNELLLQNINAFGTEIAKISHSG